MVYCRFSLTLTGQAWAKSHAQTVTFMVLPIITYVITKTISGNIALSWNDRTLSIRFDIRKSALDW